MSLIASPDAADPGRKGIASNVKGIYHELLVEHLENSDEDDVYTMYHLSSEQNKSFGGTETTMEIDTGASKTILSEDTYGRLRDALGPLEETKAVLSTYTGEQIPVVGAVVIPVKYGDQQHKLRAIIVKGSGPNLLGRDWLQSIRLDWSTILHTSSQEPRSSLDDILTYWARSKKSKQRFMWIQTRNRSTLKPDRCGTH